MILPGRLKTLPKPEATMRPRQWDEMSDAELLRRICRSEQQALETLYGRYFPRISRFAQRMLSHHEAIEEVVNDVMYVIWRKASTFNGDGQASTWIFGIAYRTCLKALRERSPGEHLALEDAEDLIPGVSDTGIDALELDDWVARLFERLPAEQRAVLELTYHQDLTYREIAEILGCPENTVKTRMFNARRTIKALIPKGGADDPKTCEGARL